MMIHRLNSGLPDFRDKHFYKVQTHLVDLKIDIEQEITLKIHRLTCTGTNESKESNNPTQSKIIHIYSKPFWMLIV